jgi:hypothetical protein
MKTLPLFVALLMFATTAAANCKDDIKDFKKAEKFGAYDFVCKDEYDGRTTSSWRMSSDNFKRYREALKQSRLRSKK